MELLGVYGERHCNTVRQVETDAAFAARLLLLINAAAAGAIKNAGSAPRPTCKTWVYCGYGGAGGPLQLFKRIADDATKCTLTTKDIGERTKQMAEFVCK